MSALYWLPQDFSVCFGKEATADYGVEVDGDLCFGYNLTWRPTARQNFKSYYHAVDAAVVADDTLTRLAHRTTEQQIEVRSALEYVVVDGRFIGYLLGVTVQGGGPTYTYTSNPAKTNVSFTVDYTGYGTGAQELTYTGGKVNTFTLSGNMNSPLAVRADCIFQDVTSKAAVTAGTVLAADPYEWYDVAVTGGLSTTYVTGFSVTGNHNLTPLWQMEDAATRTLYALVEGRTGLNGRLDFNPIASTEFDGWAAAVEVGSDLVITYTRGALDTVVITLEDVYLNDWTQGEDVSQRLIPSSLSFTCEDMSVVVTNEVDWAEW